MKDAQPALLDVAEVRHPMWAPPAEDKYLPNHLRALRTEIAKRLIPLDGRSDVRQVLAWLQDVYDDSNRVKNSQDAIYCVGDLTWFTHITAAGITNQTTAENNPARKANLVSQRETIKRISGHLIDAIIASR